MFSWEYQAISAGSILGLASLIWFVAINPFFALGLVSMYLTFRLRRAAAARTF